MSNTEKVMSDNNDIGSYLIKLREEKGIELRQISQKTRINLTLLKALEETAIERLPDLTYVKGFVKSYAKEIGADIGECLDVLEETYSRYNYTKKDLEGLQADKLIEESKLAVTGASAKKIADHVNIKGIAIGTTVIVLGFCFYLLFRDSNPPKPVAKKPTPVSPSINEYIVKEKPVTEEVKSTEQQPAAEVATQEKKTETEVKAETLKKEEPKAEEKKIDIVKTQNDEPDVKPVTRDQDIDPDTVKLDFTIRDFTLPLFEVIPNSPETEDENFLPQRAKFSVIKGLQNVFINAVYDDTWITYKSGSKPIKSFVLKKGRTIIIRDKRIQLFMGNIKAAKLFLNNQLLKVSSPTGVKSLVFPHSASADFKLPLFVFDRKTGTTFTLKEYLTKVGKLELLDSAESN